MTFTGLKGTAQVKISNSSSLMRCGDRCDVGTQVWAGSGGGCGKAGPQRLTHWRASSAVRVAAAASSMSRMFSVRSHSDSRYSHTGNGTTCRCHVPHVRTTRIRKALGARYKGKIS